jgi:hypothetical protein
VNECGGRRAAGLGDAGRDADLALILTAEHIACVSFHSEQAHMQAGSDDRLTATRRALAAE